MKKLIRVVLLLAVVAPVVAFNAWLAPSFESGWYGLYMMWCAGSGAVAGFAGFLLGEELT